MNTQPISHEALPPFTAPATGVSRAMKFPKISWSKCLRLNSQVRIALVLGLLAVGSRGDEPREPKDVPTEATPSPSAAQPEELPDTILSWDETEKAQDLKNGENIGAFDFIMTNASDEPLEVQQINVSCGCTSLTGREAPFTLKAGEKETLSVRMNVTGKVGEVIKTVYVITDRGAKTLLVTSKIFPVEESSEPTDATRDQNTAIARANRQAVFQGDCATCHAKPTKGLMGEELYATACAICHDAKHRATMVPDLKVATGPRDAAYWREHITNGREGTLMPAFAKAKNGILSEKQITSLIQFLLKK